MQTKNFQKNHKASFFHKIRVLSEKFKAFWPSSKKIQRLKKTS